MNSIAVVFREPEVLSFQEYINHNAGSDSFYTYNCSYIGLKQFKTLSITDCSSSEDEIIIEEDEDDD